MPFFTPLKPPLSDNRPPMPPSPPPPPPAAAPPPPPEPEPREEEEEEEEEEKEEEGGREARREGVRKEGRESTGKRSQFQRATFEMFVPDSWSRTRARMAALVSTSGCGAPSTRNAATTCERRVREMQEREGERERERKRERREQGADREPPVQIVQRSMSSRQANPKRQPRSVAPESCNMSTCADSHEGASSREEPTTSQRSSVS